jgi:ATP-dependent protease HslVU (ClpYQ) peptidase subunit
MTCIIAWIDKDKGAIVAGDRRGSDGWTGSKYKAPKVFKNNDFIMGYTTSFRMGQLLEHTWEPPKRMENETDQHYVYVTVVNSFRELFNKNGFGNKDNGEETGGNFIMAYKGKLYEVQPDYSIIEDENDILSVGCGENIAFGTLAAILQYEKDYKKVLTKTYEIVSHYSEAVSKEFDYITEK